MLYRYSHYTKLKKIETMFPTFLSDVTKNINTGMTLPQAMRTVSAVDYSVLSPYVKEMNAKINWGIPFEKVLLGFAKKTESKSLKRTIWTIIEAHRSGGTINTVLEAVSQSLKEMEKIKKERSTSIYSQMITGYLVYVVFLCVMIGMSKFLMPSIQIESNQSPFTELFRNMAIIQGLFAGLAIGKMSEGTLLAGIKHSLIMVTIGIAAFILFL
jgi:flagellar protein FlaJ